MAVSNTFHLQINVWQIVSDKTLKPRYLQCTLVKSDDKRVLWFLAPVRVRKFLLLSMKDEHKRIQTLLQT